MYVVLNVFTYNDLFIVGKKSLEDFRFVSRIGCRHAIIVIELFLDYIAHMQLENSFFILCYILLFWNNKNSMLLGSNIMWTLFGLIFL